MFIYISVVPFIEAAEHTIIQKVVPQERQGRVFGFAQSVEMAASPLTTFFIGPIAELFFIPFMTTGAGVGPHRRLVRHRRGSWHCSRIHTDWYHRVDHHIDRDEHKVLQVALGSIYEAESDVAAEGRIGIGMTIMNAQTTKHETDFPRNIGNPARRALEHAGYTEAQAVDQSH